MNSEAVSFYRSSRIHLVLTWRRIMFYRTSLHLWSRIESLYNGQRKARIGSVVELRLHHSIAALKLIMGPLFKF